MSYALLGRDGDNNKIEVLKSDRLQHCYVLGISGYGKTTLLTSLILQDIKQQIGVAVIDPLGGLINSVLSYLPKERENDVVYLRLDSVETPFGLNLYECPDPTDTLAIERTADRVMHVWERVFGITTDTPLLLDYMRVCAQTIVANPGYTMVEIPRLLMDKPFRDSLLTHVTDMDVRLFWQHFDSMYGRDRNLEVNAVMRRLRNFTRPIIKNIVGQTHSTIDFKKIIDAQDPKKDIPGKIFLIKLDTQLSEHTVLIGSMVIAELRRASYAREDTPLKDRQQFHVYCDEFQNFITPDMQDVLNTSRQYRVGMTLAHQNRGRLHEQFPELATDVLDASTFVCLQLNPEDAKKDMAGKFDTTPPEPEMEVWGTKKVQTPVQDVLHTLRLRGRHKDTWINWFIQKFPSPTNYDWFINEILRKAMMGEDYTGIQVSTPGGLFLMNVLSGSKYTLFMQPSGWNLLPGITKRVNDAALEGLQHYWSSSQGLSHLDAFYYTFLRNNKLEQLKSELIYVVKHLQANTLHEWKPKEDWYQIIPSQIQWGYGTTKYIYNEKIIELKPDEYWRFPEAITETYITLPPNEEKKFYQEEDLERAIQQELSLARQMFIDGIKAFRNVLAALRDSPILADSGEEEPDYRPGQRLTHDQIRDSIEAQLISLRTGWARVRVKSPPPNLRTQVCHRCGKPHLITGEVRENKELIKYLPDTCDVCKIPLRTEYVIRITQIDQEMDKDGKPKYPHNPNIDPMIQRIIANNLRQGYLRRREDVEQEIAARQQPPNEPPQPPSGANPKTPPTQPSNPPPMKRQNKIV